MKFLFAVAIFAAFLYASKYLGSVITTIIAVVLIAFLLWNRRALILTQLASQAYFVKGDKDSAYKKYQAAYDTGLMTSNCKVSFAAFCLYTEKFDRCRRLLNEVINSSRSLDADRANARHYMAILTWKEGDLDEAITLMEEVHKDFPSTGTYGSLGAFYLEKAKKNQVFDEYLDFMLEAYDYNESDKTIVDNLGELYLNLGKYEEAKEVYEKLLVQNQISPVPYYNFGRVLKALGETDRAKEVFEKALGCTFTRSLIVTKEDVEKEIANLN